jgi:hypothetical protein
MMEIMGLLKPNSRLFDPVRKKWVEPEPEEIIRQELIQKMLSELGYPLSLLAVEKELSLLPHLRLVQREAVPKRRADVIVFAKEIHPDHVLFPLLMVECKAVPLTPKFARQVVGYNSFVQAPYLALANGIQMLTGHFDQAAGHFRFESGLPPYEALLAGVKQRALK